MAGRKLRTWKIRQTKDAPNKPNARKSVKIFKNNMEILQRLEAENREAAAAN